jgi:4-amino-4-deoxy-L-arabinose transferase-like glycosyltransferase
VITAGVGALLMLLVYIGLSAIVLVQATPLQGRLVRILIVAVAMAVAGLGIYGSVTPFPSGPERWEIWFALVGVGVGLVLVAADAFSHRQVPEA